MLEAADGAAVQTDRVASTDSGDRDENGTTRFPPGWDDAGVKMISSPVIGCAADIAKDVFSKAELELLFMKAGLDGFMPSDSYGKAELVVRTVRGAQQQAADADLAARKALYEFVRLVAERTAPAEDGDVPAGTPFWQLREALRSDGLDLVAEYETTEEMWGRSRSRLLGARLLPLDEPRAPLSDEITALEHEFDRLGLTVARNCYRQAVDNLVEQRFEAANGQLRAMFEAVAVYVATAHGFTTTMQGAGGAAIRYLVDQGLLPDNDGGSFVRGLWQITHTNGPHPGASHAGEARFRLQALTGVARYLIDRFTPAQ
ncbi:hypothetical protein ACFYXJ_21160 [Streptomyces sp. NPDC002667]|uniref:hypothetical protein n=1 Tax=Streptomyces sp. NPDC002667 TaxID=3364657 RepID=UPI0036B3E93D